MTLRLPSSGAGIPSLRDASSAAALVGVLAGAGILAVVRPQAAVSLAALPLAVAILRSAYVRLLVAVLGGVFVLDSSAGLNYPKILYLLGFALSFIVAWHRLRSSPGDGVGARIAMTAERAFLAIAAVVTLSLPVALFFGRAPELWLRDVAPYLLLAAVPILAVDAARHVGRRFLTGLFVLAGALATMGFVVQLLALRQLAALPLDQLFLSSLVLSVGLFSYASARVLQPGSARPWRWAFLAAAILAAVLASGTRSALLLLVAPPAMLLLSSRLSMVKRGIVLATAGALLVVGTFAFGGALGLATGDAQERLTSVEAAIESPGEDGSLEDRFAQGEASWEAFTSSPLLGVGPGYVFEWRTPSGVPRQTFTVDSPLSTLAKFGLLGALVLAAFAVAIARLTRMGGDRVALAALLGFAAAMLPYLVLTNPFEDKGLALSLLMILALAMGGSSVTGPGARRERRGRSHLLRDLELQARS